jgi:hypothetical protein
MNVREVQILSKLRLEKWHGALAEFHKLTAKTPSEEFQQIAWPDLLDAVDFSKPKTLAHKKMAKAFIPCLLKGDKVRSPDNVTQANWLAIDIDAMDEKSFYAGLAKLREDNVTFAWYSTFSQERPHQKGMDVRLLVPIDIALGSQAYAEAVSGLGAWYFNQPFKAALSQQQAVRVIQETKHYFRVHVEPENYQGGVISAEFLISGVAHV